MSHPVTIVPGWVLHRSRCPAREMATPGELLTQSALLPGTFRLGRSGEEVTLLGELPEDADVEEALVGQKTDSRPEAEPIESALDIAGFPWRRRDESWAIPASASLPREIQLRAEPGEVRVEAVLITWDEIGPQERSALEKALCRAQLGLGFARCEMDNQQARLTARVAGEQVEQALPHALGGVAAGVRLLAHEAAALLVPNVAAAYLRFFDTNLCNNGVPAA